MKKSKLIRLTAAAFLLSASVIAQQNSKEVIYIKSARFATPLVKEWISEYEKAHSQTEIKLAEGDSSDESIDINLVSFNNAEDHSAANQLIAYTGRYALLPIAHADNPFLNELSRKGLNGKKLENLFFEKDIFEATSRSAKKERHETTIYSGTHTDSFSKAFASHFGYSSVDIKGKKISGDDVYLIHAIQKDNSGITFNNLSYIFDIETRSLKNDLSLIPLDVKKDQREILQEADIDKTLELLEKENIPLIPVESIGFVYQKNNLAAKRFLKWVLSEGQQYNHKYGFLKTEETVIASQLKSIEESLLTASQ